MSSRAAWSTCAAARAPARASSAKPRAARCCAPGQRSQWVKVQRDGGPRGWVARRLLWGLVTVPWLRLPLRLLSVNVGRCQRIRVGERSVLSTIGKRAVAGAVSVGRLGLDGDEQADPSDARRAGQSGLRLPGRATPSGGRSAASTVSACSTKRCRPASWARTSRSKACWKTGLRGRPPFPRTACCAWPPARALLQIRYRHGLCAGPGAAPWRWRATAAYLRWNSQGRRYQDKGLAAASREP